MQPTSNGRPLGELQVLASHPAGNEVLQRAAKPDNAIQGRSASPGAINAGDSGYFGYWSKEEVLNFLKELLENERIGARAFAEIGRAADLHTADLIFDGAQGAICVLLKKEIAKRGGARTLRRNSTTAIPAVKCSLKRMTAFASCNQTRLADMIEEAVLNIFDSKLNAKLMYLLLLHRKQVEQLETFSPERLGCDFVIPAAPARTGGAEKCRNSRSLQRRRNVCLPSIIGV